ELLHRQFQPFFTTTRHNKQLFLLQQVTVDQAFNAGYLWQGRKRRQAVLTLQFFQLRSGQRGELPPQLMRQLVQVEHAVTGNNHLHLADGVFQKDDVGDLGGIGGRRITLHKLEQFLIVGQLIVDVPVIQHFQYGGGNGHGDIHLHLFRWADYSRKRQRLAQIYITHWQSVRRHPASAG